MDMKRLIALLLSGVLSLAYGANPDYTDLMKAVATYDRDPTDATALNTILDTAKSDGPETVVTRCMGLYILHMGLTGNASICQGGYQSLCSRYPSSAVTVRFQDLNIVPVPCDACKGSGVIQQQRQVTCESCKNTGKCQKCDGYGEYCWCPSHRCQKKYKKSDLRYPNGTFRTHCPNCGTLLKTSACTDCSKTGKCPQCRGNSATTVSVQKCPFCKGIPKAINMDIAKSERARLCQALSSELETAAACDAWLAEAMRIESLPQRLQMLENGVARFEGALTLEPMITARNETAKLVSDLRLSQEAEQSILAENERAKTEQQAQVLDQHQALLRVIRNTPSKAAALVELQHFMDENPDSPVIVEARLVAAELGQAMTAENNARKRNRYITIGCGSFMGLAVVAWLVSCVKFARPKEIVIAQQAPARENPPRKIPLHGVNRTPHLPMLLPKRSDTPFEYAAYCPECEALLECPPDIQDMNVICSACQKPFHVN